MEKLISDQMKTEYENSIVRQNLLNWISFQVGETFLYKKTLCQSMQDYLRQQGVLIEEWDSQTKKSYDYIMLMEDILSKEPFLLTDEILLECQEKLSADGRVLIAMNNPMGMRYWSGAAEDITGEAYVGLEGIFHDNNLPTYSRKTLSLLFNRCGMKADFYYPMPDYIFPTEIFSDEYLPGQGDIRGQSPAYFGQNYVMFRENLVYDKVCKDGLFPYFANSFLVIASKEKSE